MSESAILIRGKKKSRFLDKVKEILPEQGNLDACLTCGACSSGCPATGIDGLDPRKVLRMAALGMDKELTTTLWAWACTMCMRCIYVCPMEINIPQLVFNMRAAWPREKRPAGIVGSCDAALKNDSCSAMGLTSEMPSVFTANSENDERLLLRTASAGSIKTDVFSSARAAR